jgi:chromosome segregation protein
LHIKRLEIFGFKSFADRTTLELAPGITVSVGPNGCGKSNIADALRWVLGEQSIRLLRGSRMDDIIFNGAASRKPLGFAEVSVTLDHSDGRLGLDYREVTVTRRLYRDGMSEYLLNRRACRLKEILDLFMDTGIGKEAYSFIGQGRIDEILHSKPEERRLIFEEAAGIQKYKNRKREAERRLIETHENTLRIDDIISELSAQLEPLQGQAAAAHRYVALRDELKSAEVALFVHEAKNFRSRVSETDALWRKLTDAVLRTQTEIAGKEAELAASEIDLDAKQADVLRYQHETQHSASELEKSRGLVNLTQEQLRSAQLQAAVLTADIQELNRQCSALESGRRQCDAELAEITETIEKLAGELLRLENSMSDVLNLPEAEQLRHCRHELENHVTAARTLQSEYDRLRLAGEQLAERLHRLQQEKAQKEEQLSHLEIKCVDLSTTQNTLQQELERTAGQKYVCESNLAEQTSRKELLDRQIREGENRLAEIEGRRRLLQELESGLAGYGHAVKLILEAKKGNNDPSFKGVLGTVADLLQVPATYVVAVEAALGPALQNLVTEDDNVAKGVIAWLKKVNGGRATFLPLSLLAEQQSYRSAANIQHIDGYCGVASELADAPSRFRKVVDMLLSRVHIVRDLDTAVMAARLLRFRERVTTLDGEVIYPGGAMTGGREKRQGGILSRRRDIKELGEAYAREQENLTLLVSERSFLSGRLEEIRLVIKALAEQYHRHEQEIALNDREIAFIREQTSRLTAELCSLQEHTVELSVKADDVSVAERATLDKLTVVAGKEREIRIAMAQLEGKLAAREQEKKYLQERHTEHRIHLAALREKVEHYEATKEKQAKTERELAAALRLKEEELGKCRVYCLKLQSEIAAYEESATALEQSQKRKLSEYASREKTVRVLSARLHAEREALRQAEKEFSSLERRQHRIELEREKLEHELHAVLDRLRQNWQLDFAAAESTATPLVDYQAAIEQVNMLQHALREVGTVNLGAIDEYSRVSERINFLTAQRDDLSLAGRDLHKIIREIDGLMAEKFVAAFTVINDTFGQVFKELFGGGKSLIKLTDPQNLLESGVEIIAQPPGKRLQQLSLLSGGEKALTAIALLFSFLKVKPAPFCILDEIDTALDEANLARFNSYLCRLSAGTQFILISHRKKTMEQANTLYGVTMEEPGVSKIISVRLAAATHLETNAC